MEKYFIVCLVFLLVGCYQELSDIHPIVPEDKMVQVVSDIHLAEAMLSETGNKRTKDSLAQLFYQQIFKIHELSPEDYQQSMDEYISNPNALDRLYTKVLDYMQVEQSKRPEDQSQKDPVPKDPNAKSKAPIKLDSSKFPKLPPAIMSKKGLN